MRAAAGMTRGALKTAGVGSQSAQSSGDWPRPWHTVTHTRASQDGSELRGPEVRPFHGVREPSLPVGGSR